MVLLMGLNSIAAASVQSIGQYTPTAGGFILTTNGGAGGSVTNSEVEKFLGVSGLNGFEGSAVKDSFYINFGEIFSFNWKFSTTEGLGAGGDFSFIDLTLDGSTIFDKQVLGEAAKGDEANVLFKWTATGTGLLSYGIGILDTYDENADSSIVISNLNPVPLPAAAWLFLTGLLGLVGFKQRTGT